MSGFRPLMSGTALYDTFAEFLFADSLNICLSGIQISSLYLLPLNNRDVLSRAHCDIMRCLNVLRSISVIWLVKVLES